MRIYKILNYFFGWNYVLWKNPSEEGISKIIMLPDGTIGYWRYKNLKIFDVITFDVSNNEYNVIWLTCKQEKYFGCGISLKWWK